MVRSVRRYHMKILHPHSTRLYDLPVNAVPPPIPRPNISLFNWHATGLKCTEEGNGLTGSSFLTAETSLLRRALAERGREWMEEGGREKGEISQRSDDNHRGEQDRIHCVGGAERGA